MIFYVNYEIAIKIFLSKYNEDVTEFIYSINNEKMILGGMKQNNIITAALKILLYANKECDI